MSNVIKLHTPTRPIRPVADRPRPKWSYCSFCGKNEHEVAKLVCGPPNVYICNECVALCDDICREQCPGYAINRRATIPTLIEHP